MSLRSPLSLKNEGGVRLPSPKVSENPRRRTLFVDTRIALWFRAEFFRSKKTSSHPHKEQQNQSRQLLTKSFFPTEVTMELPLERIADHSLTLLKIILMLRLWCNARDSAWICYQSFGISSAALYDRTALLSVEDMFQNNAVAIRVKLSSQTPRVAISSNFLRKPQSLRTHLSVLALSASMRTSSRTFRLRKLWTCTLMWPLCWRFFNISRME